MKLLAIKATYEMAGYIATKHSREGDWRAMYEYGTLANELTRFAFGDRSVNFKLEFKSEQ